MSKGIELYKEFIDGLVEQKSSVKAARVENGGFPDTEDNKIKNDFIASLTAEQRKILAEMLQEDHIAGMHKTLAYLDELVDLEDLQLVQDGEILPTDYFESMHYDFICRCEGDEWPE